MQYNYLFGRNNIDIVKMYYHVWHRELLWWYLHINMVVILRVLFDSIIQKTNTYIYSTLTFKTSTRRLDI